MRLLKHFVFIYLVFTLACTSKQEKHAKSKTKPNYVSKSKLSVGMQPFWNMPLNEVSNLKSGLKKHFDTVTVHQQIDFPSNAYVKARNRYRADLLLKYMKSLNRDNIYQLGLSEMDISTTKEPHQDWGIMGLSYCPGKQSIISTFRLDKKRRTQQLYKVAVHELGHAFGLPHCSQKTCYMRDAAGKNPLNEEVCFCKRCKEFLVAKGWRL